MELDYNENPSAATLGFSIPTWEWEGLYPQADYRLFIAVQPFADEMANHTRHNSDNKRSEYFHGTHPLPVTSIGAVTGGL